MGSLLGIRLRMLVGREKPVPASPGLLESLERIEVSHRDDGPSGFQITFQVGRPGPEALTDFAALADPRLQVFSRLVLTVIFGVRPRVLMDGFITHRELDPGSEPGTSTFTVTGEDVSVMMDLEEKSEEHPSQSEMVIANKLIRAYGRYGLTPRVMPPPTNLPPNPVERTPTQQCSDRQFLEQTAERYGFTFFVRPGPAPLTNMAYWGPPPREGPPQKALSVNLGSETNVESIRFTHDAQSAEVVDGRLQDPDSGRTQTVRTTAGTRKPLALFPAWKLHQGRIRKRAFRGSGMDLAAARARAQGTTDASADDTVRATGTLDALRYGDLLEPRRLVGLRGVGYAHDGLYYVSRVTHVIQGGSYTQSFTLSREGVGSTVSRVAI